jgi:hypothetical protein
MVYDYVDFSAFNNLFNNIGVVMSLDVFLIIFGIVCAILVFIAYIIRD